MTDENKKPTRPENTEEVSADAPDLKQLLDGTNKPTDSGLVTFLGVPTKKLEALVLEKLAQKGGMGFLTDVGEIGSHSNLLYFAIPSTGGEIEFQRDLLEKVNKTSFDAKLMNEDNTTPILGSTVSIKPSASTDRRMESVSGKAGVRRMQAMRAGTGRRIPLYASGFSVDVRKPTIQEIDDLLAACRLDKVRYETQMGAPFYLFFDRLLKVNFIEFFRELVTFSTLENWSSDDSVALLSRIKLADYPAIMATIAMMMYKDKYSNFKHFCTRPRSNEYPQGCSHVTTFDLGISNLLRVAYGMLSPAAVAHMQRSFNPTTVFKPTDIDAYQSYLGHDDKRIRIGDYEFTLRNPSLADHLERAAEFNAEISSRADFTNNEDVLASYVPLRLRTYRQYIANVIVYDEMGTPALTGDDSETVEYALDDITEHPDLQKLFVEPMLAHIESLQLMYVCYPVAPCPSCGYVDDIKSGFYTLDAQNTFFTIALRKWTEVFSNRKI